jgi:capsular polysaccharide transport system permease protein
MFMGAFKKHWLFILTVLIPTSLAIIYYGFIASDIYTSESRFVVRSPQKQSTSSILGAFMQEAGFARSQEDTYSVHDYIQSRDAMFKLEKSFNIKKIFSDPSIDFINRFPTFGMTDSYESLYKYYLKHVSAESDAKTSISVLKVDAFNAEDAHKMNEALLRMSEELINNLNERGRKDLINFASAEAKAAEFEARNASLALSSYRGKNAVFDPEKQSALQLQQIARLQDELIAVNSQISQVLTFTPDNPQLPVLRNRAASLKKDIAAESEKITSGSENSLSSKAANYERLVLEKAFADKQLAGALTALESARNEAQRQQLYLERLAQPSLPDASLEPKRFKSTIAVLVLGLFTWGIFSLLLAAVREHND